MKWETRIQKYEHFEGGNFSRAKYYNAKTGTASSKKLLKKTILASPFLRDKINERQTRKHAEKNGITPRRLPSLLSNKKAEIEIRFLPFCAEDVPRGGGARSKYMASIYLKVSLFNFNCSCSNLYTNFINKNENLNNFNNIFHKFFHPIFEFKFPFQIF